MPHYVDVRYAPDVDISWSVNPGTLTSLNAFTPLQSGHYGTTAAGVVFASMTGANHVYAKTFRQIDGSVRFLAFRTQDIDEYDTNGTRTNRGTSYSASTPMWSATAWGNQIIATNYYDAPQSSTGAGFSALSGSPPKARMVASNVDFVMFADVDDGGSNVYSDMVWWCGIRNPVTWTPAQATQAGNIRLLQAPGPIRALVTYGKTFVVFKDNAIIVGQYLGPQYTFGWQMFSSSIGCVGQNAVIELDGKLYFLHTSGFYEFDGQNIRNIGVEVFQRFMAEAATINANDYQSANGDSSQAAYGLSKTQCAVDDIEGVVWFSSGTYRSATDQAEYLYHYGYNVRSGKWGRYAAAFGNITTGTGLQSPLVRGPWSEVNRIFALQQGGFVGIVNDSSVATQARRFLYPAVTLSAASATVTTGVFGDQGQAGLNRRTYLRHRKGSDSLTSTSDVTGTVSGFKDEALNVTNGTAASTLNTEFIALDHTLDARFKTQSIAYATGKKIILAGLGFDEKATGKR